MLLVDDLAMARARVVQHDQALVQIRERGSSVGCWTAWVIGRDRERLRLLERKIRKSAESPIPLIYPPK